MTAPGYVPPPVPGWWVKHDTHVFPTPAVLTLTGSAPSLVIPKTVTPAGATLTLTGSTPTVLQNAFVSRDTSSGYLMYRGQRFRFSGANTNTGLSATNSAYGATVDADGLHLASHSEIDAILDSAQAMNATVLRLYGNVLSVNKTNAIQPSLGVFNPAGFEPTDYTLQQCAIRGLKVVFPLVDNYQFELGGKFWYCSANGVTPDGDATQFFTNATIINSFKAHISAVLNRVNQYTGVVYKNDPVVAAWETGNELSASGLTSSQVATWTGSIAQHIKVTETANQLVLSGQYGLTGDLVTFDTDALALQYVDIYSDHAYDNFRTPRWLNTEAQVAHSFGKAFVVGEYAWPDIGQNWNLVTLLSGIESSQSIDGDMFWNLLAPLANYGGGYTLHRPGDDANMQARGTQLADHCTVMSAGRSPTVTVVDSTSTSVLSNSLSLTFDGAEWTPKANDAVVFWAAFSQSGGIIVPGGWNNVLVGNTVVDAGSHTEYCVYHQVTSAEEAAGTLTYTANAIQGNLQTTICGVVLRGVDPNSPIDSAATAFSSSIVTPHVLAGLSGGTVSTDSLVLSGVAKDGVGGYNPPDGWGRASFGETNETLHVMARNARTVAGTNVAATNITPLGGGDEYTSITVAFSQKVEPVTPILAPIPNRFVGPMALRNQFRRAQQTLTIPDYRGSAGADTPVTVGLTASGVVGAVGSATTPITVGLQVDGFNPDNVSSQTAPTVTIANRFVGPQALRQLFRRPTVQASEPAPIDGGDATGTGTDIIDGGDATGTGTDGIDGGSA